MNLYNLTKNIITLRDIDGEIFEILPSGETALLHTTTIDSEVELLEGHKMHHDTIVVSGAFNDRFPRVKGTLYIVPKIVAQAYADREDLVFPYRVAWGREIGQVLYADGVASFEK